MLRSDLWVAAFVRRHNDIGHLCVVARKGDAAAGQIFIAIDHLNGTSTLLTPAPSSARGEGDDDRLFMRRFDHGERKAVEERIEMESRFDPDLWVIDLEMRGDDAGVEVAG
ncbi:MAG TPA: DUF1491 family protein [Devosia sp.]|nr:DUF1491 family protein [Devosia sp.]